MTQKYHKPGQPSFSQQCGTSPCQVPSALQTRFGSSGIRTRDPGGHWNEQNESTLFESVQLAVIGLKINFKKRFEIYSKI